MNIELDESQIRGIIWLMEDEVSQSVMSLPQFEGMRAAKETLQKALDSRPRRELGTDGLRDLVAHSNHNIKSGKRW